MKEFIQIVLIFILSFISCVSFAQDDEPMDFNLEVMFENQDGGGNKAIVHRQITYFILKTPHAAEVIKEKVFTAACQEVGEPGPMISGAWDKMLAELGIAKKVKKTKLNGLCTVHAIPGMALLICSYNPDDEESYSDIQCEVVQLKKSEKELKVTFKSKVLGGHETTGHGKKPEWTTPPVFDDGKNITGEVKLAIPKGIGKSSSRLIIQPLIVRCLTEDTIAYVKGFMYEGSEYHTVQNRVQAFDYFKNDILADELQYDALLDEADTFRVKKTATWRKINPQETYKMVFKIDMGDYTNSYYHLLAANSSCNAIKYFKFVDFGMTTADMDIDEFYVPADVNYERVNQDLKLKFVRGQETLTNDSVNDKEKQNLNDLIQRYGDKIISVTVSAYSSPEGGYDSNMKLAGKRREVAYSMIKKYSRIKDFPVKAGEIKVFSWSDVATALREDYGKPELADQILDKMGPNGYGGDEAIRQIPGYLTEIEPVMETFRRMTLTYIVDKDEAYKPEEIEAKYKERKQSLLKGTGKNFSDGDYYNLFTMVKDSCELDTITTIAYKYMIKEPAYEKKRFSMYVANRYAMLMIKQGTQDSTILKPFVKQNIKGVKSKEKPGERAYDNRREILINQLITKYLDEERVVAYSLMNYWFKEDKDPNVQKLKNYVTFKTNFFGYGSGSLNEQEKTEFEVARDYVFSCSPDNKAALMTEARKILNNTSFAALEEVEKMSDDNPKKWYLLAILAAENENPKVNRSKSYVPEYMVYLHHAIKLDPALKKVYFTDGQFSDDLRSKYPYSRKKFSIYEEKLSGYRTIHVDGQQNETEDDLKDAIDIPDDNKDTVKPGAEGNTEEQKAEV